MSNLYRGPSFLVSVHLAKLFQKLTNQKQELPVAAMFVNRSGRYEQFLRGPFIDASHQISVHLAKQFQRRFFRNRAIRKKNCLWRPCLLIDRDDMSNFLENLP